MKKRGRKLSPLSAERDAERALIDWIKSPNQTHVLLLITSNLIVTFVLLNDKEKWELLR